MGARRIVLEFERKTPRGSQMWCSVHDSHPGDCAELHHPFAYGKNR